MKQHAGLTIKTRLIGAVALALFTTTLVIALSLIGEKNALTEDRQVKTRHLVEAAYGVLEHFHSLQQAGALSEDQAKRAAIDTIKKMRYEGKEYFWINDMHPTMVMHPIKPELDGKDLSDFKDPNGKRLFVAFVDKVKKDGAGFVDYLWPKPGFDKPVPKISYVKAFEPWGWVIGSGIYLDDVSTIFWNRVALDAGIVVIFFVLMGGGMALLIRNISRSLGSLESAISRIQASNDLTQRVHIDGNDEISRIALSFNQLIGNFQRLIQQVIDGVHEVKRDVEQLSASADHVAESSHRQSDATASMASAVEEMSVSIDSISENSNGAHETARHSGELSTTGGAVVQNASAEMSKIAEIVNHASEFIHVLGEHSSQISEIVKVIKEIADQTNLLALNAAIEAARAGEQGRGFAVVADEVRKLAERTTKSTEEITAMIERIQAGTDNAVSTMKEGTQRVGEGVTMANRAGNAMAEITEGANRVVTAIGAITHALNEQSAASRQVAESVERVAEMAEKNGLEVNQINQTAQQLDQLASQLQSAVSQFKI